MIPLAQQLSKEEIVQNEEAQWQLKRTLKGTLIYFHQIDLPEKEGKKKSPVKKLPIVSASPPRPEKTPGKRGSSAKKTNTKQKIISEKNNMNKKDAEKKDKQNKRQKIPYGAEDTDGEDSSSTDEAWEKRVEKSRIKRRSQMKPINLKDLGIYDEKAAPEYQGKKKENANADITTMEVDMNVDWSAVGGLKGHVQKLQEMILLPMLYPEEFNKFKIQPPRGVIFHGPPGTGKTLVARVLAAEASKNGQKVSFYMRKGADVLSKWVGEAERQLRLLFSEAYKNQPSIIFFDEIDGLAPVRSSRQDQIHSSIVSTLLALMDGLDKRGQVIIIGATNRIDSLDPALRRPGRFDRELVFNLPSRVARRQILEIHTREWNPRVSSQLLDELAVKTVGYCGADIEGLCREAFLHCFRRTYPQIYSSKSRIRLEKNLIVREEDFEMAYIELVPSSKRSNIVCARPLPKHLLSLLNPQFQGIRSLQKDTFPLGVKTKSQIANLEASLQENDNEENSGSGSNYKKYGSGPIRPRLLIHGDYGLGQNYYGPAVLHALEEFPIYSIDLPTILGDATCRHHDEAIYNQIKEARRNSPSIVYWPRIDTWCESLNSTTLISLIELLEDTPPEYPVYLVATSEIPVEFLLPQLQVLFPENRRYQLKLSRSEELDEYWKQLESQCFIPLKKKDVIFSDPTSPVNNNNNPVIDEQNNEEKKKSPMEIVDPRLSEDKNNFTLLRIALRGVMGRLQKHFQRFFKPIEYDDNNDIIETNTGLQEIREIVNGNDENGPITISSFLDLIDELVQEVKNSYGRGSDESDIGREYVNEVCHLQDTALSMVMNLDANLAEKCELAHKRWKEKEEENQDKEKKKQKKQPRKRRTAPRGKKNTNKNSNNKKQVASKKNDNKDTNKNDNKDINKNKNEEKKVIRKKIPIPQMSTPASDSGNNSVCEEIEENFGIDKTKLRSLLKIISKNSKDRNIVELQNWYFEFISVCFKFSNKSNRKNVITELEKKLNSLRQQPLLSEMMHTRET